MPREDLTGTLWGIYRPGLLGTYRFWRTRIPGGGGYWGYYIYCGKENFTSWGPEEHHELGFAAGVGLLLLPLDHETILLLQIRGMKQATLLISGITP